MKSNGIEFDPDIENALAWLCSLVPGNNDFTSRLVKSQREGSAWKTENIPR